VPIEGGRNRGRSARRCREMARASTHTHKRMRERSPYTQSAEAGDVF